MNEQFNQLMVQEQAGLTADQLIFVETHKQIISYGNLAARSFVEMGHKLKEMRDGELYKAAGFENFGDYTEQAAGIKERQAYNYINVVERYDEKYLAEHANLGVTKLLALSTASEEEREEIAETIDLKKASSRKIQDAVKAAQKERDEARERLKTMQQEYDDLTTELDTARQEKDDAESARTDIQTAYDKKKEELREAQEEVGELTAKKKELEAKKKELEEQLETAQKAKTKVKTEIKTVPDETAQKELDDARKQLKAKEEERQELDRKLRETTVQLEEAKEQKRAIAQDDIITFKIKFDEIQRLGGEIITAIGKMEEEIALKCKNAVAAVMKNWQEAFGI